MKEIAIVTGASSGIGAEFARQIAKDFWSAEIWLVARRRKKLKQLAAEIEKNSAVKTKIIAVDLAAASGRKKLFDLLREEKPLINLLVNNAGYGDIGPFAERAKDKQIGMIELNIRALTEITYESLPYMQKGSHLIQTASLAAFVPMPYFAVYAATKAYVLHFSLALNEELKGRGIHCMALCPGAVKTEFATVATDGVMKQFSVGAVPSKIVKIALKKLKRKKAMVIPGFWWKINTRILSWVPKVWAAHFAKKRMKKR